MSPTSVASLRRSRSKRGRAVGDEAGTWRIRAGSCALGHRGIAHLPRLNGQVVVLIDQAPSGPANETRTIAGSSTERSTFLASDEDFVAVYSAMADDRCSALCWERRRGYKLDIFGAL